MKLFKKNKNQNKVEDFNKLSKKRKKDELELLEEYKKGLVIKVDSDVNQKELMERIRKG